MHAALARDVVAERGSVRIVQSQQPSSALAAQSSGVCLSLERIVDWTGFAGARDNHYSLDCTFKEGGLSMRMLAARRRHHCWRVSLSELVVRGGKIGASLRV